LDDNTIMAPSAEELVGPAVPEPTTVIAGVLMLFPFGASTMHILLKKRRG